MTAVIQLPLWTVPAVLLALCLLAIRWVERASGRGEKERLRALDALWADEPGVSGESVRGYPVPPGLAAPADTGIYPWPRETIYARVEPKDAA